MDPQRLKVLALHLITPGLRRALARVPGYVAHQIAEMVIVLELSQRHSEPWDLGEAYPNIITNKTGTQHLILERRIGPSPTSPMTGTRVIFEWRGASYEESFW